MDRRPKTIVLALTAIFILSVISGTILLGYTVYWVLGLILGHPPTISLPWEARLAGFAILALGAAVIFDVTRYRRPMDILISTADTYTKLIGRRPLAEKTMRTEPFIPKGPYVYTRNPMYFGAVMLTLGFGLALSSTPLLLWALVVTCWFWFVIIPLEEKELQALFGEAYRRYRRQVPKLFPNGRRLRANENTSPN